MAPRFRVGVHLMPMFTIAYASVGGLLLAADLPFAQEMTAMAMVGVFFLWLIRRENRREVRDDINANHRLGELETEVASLREEAREQRHEKHQHLNRLAALRGTLLLIQQMLLLVQEAARNCTCRAMDPSLPVVERVLPVVDQIITDLPMPAQTIAEEP